MIEKNRNEDEHEKQHSKGVWESHGSYSYLLEECSSIWLPHRDLHEGFESWVEEGAQM